MIHRHTGYIDFIFHIDIPAGSGEDGGGECGEGGVVVWMAWLLRCGCGDVGGVPK